VKRRILAIVLLFGCGDVGLLRIVNPTFDNEIPTVLPTEVMGATVLPTEVEDVIISPTETVSPTPTTSPTPTEPPLVLTNIKINQQTFQAHSRNCHQNDDDSYNIYLMANYGDKDLLVYLFVPVETHSGTHYDNLQTGIQVQPRFEEISYTPERYVASMTGSCVWSFNRTIKSGSIACEFFLVNNDPRDYFGNEVTLHTVNFTCD
jgi:hypothetical protein